jgi:hypothetical protein
MRLWIYCTDGGRHRLVTDPKDDIPDAANADYIVAIQRRLERVEQELPPSINAET